MYQGRIVIDQDIMAGEPVITGTRIPVEVVLGKLAQNPDLNELFADYPRLTLEDVRACLEFAAHLVNLKETREQQREVLLAQPQ